MWEMLLGMQRMKYFDLFRLVFELSSRSYLYCCFVIPMLYSNYSCFSMCRIIFIHSFIWIIYIVPLQEVLRGACTFLCVTENGVCSFGIKSILTGLLTYLFTYLLSYLPKYLSTYLATYLPTYLPTYLSTYL